MPEVLEQKQKPTGPWVILLRGQVSKDLLPGIYFLSGPAVLVAQILAEPVKKICDCALQVIQTGQPRALKVGEKLEMQKLGEQVTPLFSKEFFLVDVVQLQS